MTAIRSVVLGCGSYLPERILTNAELATRLDTSDEWIVQRTGIRERHVAAEGEFTSHLAIKAARAAASPRSEVTSPSAAMWRSRMPVRCTIHSSDVSTILVRSSLVTRRAGR